MWTPLLNKGTKKRCIMWSLLLLLALLLLPFPSTAKTIWVATSGGNDGNSCTAAQTNTTPKATITAGIGCLVGGDTLIVKSGTYAEAIKDTIPAGSAGAPTTVKSEVQYGAVIKPSCSGSGPPSGCDVVLYAQCTIVAIEKSHIVFDGFTVDAGNANTSCRIMIDMGGYAPSTDITISNNDVVGHCPDANSGSNCLGMSTHTDTSNVTVRGNKVHDIGWGATSSQSFWAYCSYLTFHDSIIENNEFYNCSGFAIQMWSSGSPTDPTGPDRSIIRGNYVHDVGLSCFLIASGDNQQVYNNVLVNCGKFFDSSTGSTVTIQASARGLRLGNSGLSTTNQKAYYNTIVGATGHCIEIGADGAGTVRNNICYQNGTNDVNVLFGTVAADHNLFGTNPNFANQAGGDYHLTSSSTAALDNGICVSGITTGKDGEVRPQPTGGSCDIGAYEGTGGATIPPPTQTLLAWWK